MNILLVSATHLEIESFKQKIQADEQLRNQITILITGVGSVQTAYSLTRHISRSRPDFVLCAGIAGGFSREISLGTVVQVRSEVFADLGVQESRGWSDVFDLGLLDKDGRPFRNGRLENPSAPLNISALNAAGCTVNQVTTDPARIEIIQKLYAPMVESLEGAAVHYVCLQENLPFTQLRSISNLVGERDKQRWRIQEALENLSLALEEAIQKLMEQQ